MNTILSYFILLVLAAVATLLGVAIVRLVEHRSHQDRQLGRTSKTVSRLIVRNVELDRLLGSSLL